MIKIGILCPSEIAFRRFMPALQQCDEIEYVGVAYATQSEWFDEDTKNIPDEKMKATIQIEQEKAEKFKELYGGEVYKGYADFLTSGKLDAVYIPLPPGLHYKWAKMALESGLHVLVEKPATTSMKETKELIEIAASKQLAFHENYMFTFHSQLTTIANEIAKKQIGDVRLYRVDFGFPFRSANDFRYIKSLGGGALFDCGGYTLKYGNILLGGNAKVDCAMLQYMPNLDIDIGGAGMLSNEEGQTVQVAFGMDNDYRCNIEVWGSKGTLISKRILTAPSGFTPTYFISRNGEEEEYVMEPDDAFLKSIQWFGECIHKEDVRNKNYKEIEKQSILVSEFAHLAGKR